MSISENRKDVRKEFSDLLTAGVTAAEAVYAGEVDDFGGKSPVVVVSGNGTGRNPITVGNFSQEHRLCVLSFVLYKDEASGWDEMDAEDALDDIEYQVYQVVKANQKGEHWGAISYAGVSQTAPVNVGGVDYKREEIVLIFS